MVQSKLGINDFVPMLARSVDNGATWSEPVPVFPRSVTDRCYIRSFARSDQSCSSTAFGHQSTNRANHSGLTRRKA